MATLITWYENPECVVLTVGELLEIPHLRLQLYAGQLGLDRTVSWAHISDLPNPWEWLGEGELLLTNGLSLPPSPVEQPAFLRAVEAAGASGLALGADTPAPPPSHELKRHADDLGFAVLLVPYSVRFTAIVKAVADANRGEESRRLARVARVYELLRVAVAGGEPRKTIFRRLGAELGCHLHLVDPELGKPLFPQDEPIGFSEELVEAYAAHAGILPGVLHLNSAGDRAAAISVPGEQPAVLVAVPTGARPPELDLLQHVTTIAAIEMASLRVQRERRRNRAADLLSRLLDGRLEDRVARSQLREWGLQAETAVVLAMSNTDDRGDEPYDQLVRRGLPHLLIRRDNRLYAIVPGDTSSMRTFIHSFRPDRAGVSAEIGTAHRIPEAAREALWALGLAATSEKRVVRFADDSPMLVPRTLDEAHIIVSRILGPLVAYDADHNSRLLATLRAVLQANRSWNQAARYLHIHKQTLGYRIRKIEQLTGRGLKTTGDIAELWYAMRAYDLIQGRSADHG